MQHLNLLGVFVSYEENEVLWIQSRSLEKYINKICESYPWLHLNAYLGIFAFECY